MRPTASGFPASKAGGTTTDREAVAWARRHVQDLVDAPRGEDGARQPALDDREHPALTWSFFSDDEGRQLREFVVGESEFFCAERFEEGEGRV